MNIDIQVRYVTTSNEVLCFKHAVQAAVKNVDIIVQIDDFEDDHFIGSTQCVECLRLHSFGVRKATESTGSM